MSENVLNLAATAFTSWNTLDGKHGFYSYGIDLGESLRPTKRARIDSVMVTAPSSPTARTMTSYETQARSDNALTTEGNKPFMTANADIKAYPFFHYKDHSTDEDPDTLTPLTLPGRVPK
jgi:hypothetical protein